MRDRQFQRLRQKHRDAVAANQAVRLQHVGEAAREIGYLIERGPRRHAILVDIDQRQPSRAIGMTVAAQGGEIEPRRDIPAEVAVEGFVVGGFGEHARSLPDFFLNRRPRSSRGRGPIASERGEGLAITNIRHRGEPRLTRRTGPPLSRAGARLRQPAPPSPGRWPCRNPSARHISPGAPRSPCPCPSCQRRRSRRPRPRSLP